MSEDLQVLVDIVLAAVALAAFSVFVILPGADYIKELREFRAGKWRGEWSESRRRDILRYTRNVFISSAAGVVFAGSWCAASLVFVKILMTDSTGNLPKLGAAVAGMLLSLWVGGKFNPHKG